MIGDVLQPTHLIFILVVALLVLGPKRLPEVGRSLGKGLRDFRGAMSGDFLSGEDQSESDTSSAQATSPPPVTPATTVPAEPADEHTVTPLEVTNPVTPESIGVEDGLAAQENQAVVVSEGDSEEPSHEAPKSEHSPAASVGEASTRDS